MKGSTIGYIVVSAGVAGLLGYYFYNKSQVRKALEVAAGANTQSPVNTSQGGSVSTRPTQTTTAPTKPLAPAAPSIGTKLFAGPTGANLYKTPQASQTNIYKYYPSGSYLGTYLGKEGVYTKIVVEETGFLSNSFKTVYALTSNIKF